MKDPPIYRILRFSQKYPVALMSTAVLITAVMAYFAFRVRVEPDLESFIPEDEEISRLIEKYSAGRRYTNYIMLAVERDDPFEPKALAAFAEAIGEIGELPHVVPLYNPFNLISFRSRGKRLEVVQPAREVPQTEKDIAALRDLIRDDPIGRQLLISSDGKILSALFGTMDMDDTRSEMSSFQEIVDGLEKHYKVYTSGLAVATYKGIQYVQKDLPRLLAITLAFILLMYYLGFRVFRAVALPIVVVSMSTVWALGFMGLMGFNITVVSITTPPLVLILGTSYSIHVLNQYYREDAEGRRDSLGDVGWIARAVTNVSRTIVMASATTVIGFLSLLGTTIGQIREFGLSTSVGIVSCTVLSLFFLPAALSLLKPPTAVQRKKIMEGAISRLMKKTSRGVVRFPALILIAVAAGAVGFAFARPLIRHQYDYFSYFPPHEKLVVDAAYTARKLGGVQQLQVTLSAPNGEKNYFLDSSILERVDRFESKLLSHPHVVSTLSFVSYLKQLNASSGGVYGIPKTRGLILLLANFIKVLSSEQSFDSSLINLLASPDFSRITISFRVYNADQGHYLFEEELRSLKASIETDSKEILEPVVKAELWGSSLRFLSLSRTVNRDLRNSTLLAVFLIFFVTSLSFRSFLYGLCSLFPLLTGIMINFITMAVARIPLDMATVMVSSIAIGVGVDNSIHLLIQFRKQRQLFPEDIESALAQTLAITGRPILLTTASIVGGILILAFASFRPIIYFGVLVSITLFATAIGSLLVLPTILYVGRTLFAGREAKKKNPAGGPLDS